MVAPLRTSLEEEVQDFDLRVKMTFLEYVPRQHQRRSQSVPSQSGSGFLRKDSEETTCSPRSSDATLPTLLSMGSLLHQTGTCKPCAWYWKPTGCMNGAECRHCHLCPFGELTRRKRCNRKLARKVRDNQVAESVSDSPSSPFYQSDSSLGTGTAATAGTGSAATGRGTTTTPSLSSFVVSPHDLADVPQSGHVPQHVPHIPEPLEPLDPDETNPRRKVPRAQTWQNTPAEPRDPQAPFVRAQTWQATPPTHPTPTLQSVPEGGVPRAPAVVLLLPLVTVQVQPVQMNPTFSSSDCSDNC